MKNRYTRLIKLLARDKHGLGEAMGTKPGTGVVYRGLAGLSREDRDRAIEVLKAPKLKDLEPVERWNIWLLRRNKHFQKLPASGRPAAQFRGRVERALCRCDATTQNLACSLLTDGLIDRAEDLLRAIEKMTGIGAGPQSPAEKAERAKSVEWQVSELAMLHAILSPRATRAGLEPVPPLTLGWAAEQGKKATLESDRRAAHLRRRGRREPTTTRGGEPSVSPPAGKAEFWRRERALRVVTKTSRIFAGAEAENVRVQKTIRRLGLERFCKCVGATKAEVEYSQLNVEPAIFLRWLEDFDIHNREDFLGLIEFIGEWIGHAEYMPVLQFIAIDRDKVLGCLSYHDKCELARNYAWRKMAHRAMLAVVNGKNKESKKAFHQIRPETRARLALVRCRRTGFTPRHFRELLRRLLALRERGVGAGVSKRGGWKGDSIESEGDPPPKETKKQRHARLRKHDRRRWPVVTRMAGLVAKACHDPAMGPASLGFFPLISIILLFPVAWYFGSVSGIVDAELAATCGVASG
jgi:hypothetical protein